MTKSSLPKGWRLVKFGDVVDNMNETTKDPKSIGLDRVVGLDHMDPESLPLKRWDNFSDLHEGTSFTRVFRSGQVLFGKRRAYQRKVSRPDFDGICSGDILVFRPKNEELLPEFLPYLVQSDGFFDHALGTSAGSLSPRTKWQELAKYEFALPSIAEQQRITTLVSTLDSAVESYSAIAFDKIVASIVNDYKSLGSSSWRKHSLGEISELVTRGRAPNYCEEGGIVVLNQKCIRDGKVSTELARRTDVNRREVPSWAILKSGDVLVNSTGTGTLGRTAEFKELGEPVTFDSHITLVRANQRMIYPSYLSLELRTREAELERVGNGSTGQAELNRDAIKRLTMLVPPMNVQLEILGQVESVHRTKIECQATLRNLSSLRRAILKKTIHGDVNHV
jgi:type I restriction enzyme S subunit